MSLTCFELEYLKSDINLLGMALHRDRLDVEQVMIAEPVAPSYDTSGDVIRLSCIKSAQYPDETADQGRHCFTYSLLPHRGSFQQAGVVQSAAEMNNPLIVKAITASSGTKPAKVTMFKSSNLAVIIDTTKPAEDGFGTVVRIYESYGSHSKTIIKIGMNLTNIQEVNLMEKPVSHTDLGINKEEKTVTLTLKPFQIVSLKF